MFRDDRAVALIGVAVLGLYYFSTDWRLLAGEVLMLIVLFARRPVLALAFAVFAIPFYFSHKEVGPLRSPPAEVLTAVCLVVWLIGGRERTGRHRVLKRAELDWAVLAFVVWSILSLAVSEDRLASLQELRLMVIEPALLYFLVRRMVRSQAELLTLVDALVLVGLAVALVGLFQYTVTGDVIEAEGVRRLRSVYYSPNHPALFLERVVPLAACVALFGASQGRQGVYGLAGVAMLVAIYLTFSRGAWLLGLPAAVVFIGWMRGRRAMWIALAGVAVIALAVIPVAGTRRFASLLDFAGGTWRLRLILWEGTFNLIRAHPVFGVGLDNFRIVYPRYRLPEAWQEPVLYHPHNAVLDFWVRLGLPGVAALVWLEVAFFREALAAYRQCGDQTLRAVLLGAMGAMVAGLAHGLVDTIYFLPDLAFVFMLLLGLVRSITLCDIQLVTNPD